MPTKDNFLVENDKNNFLEGLIFVGQNFKIMAIMTRRPTSSEAGL